MVLLSADFIPDYLGNFDVKLNIREVGRCLMSVSRAQQ
jgi:hypothetical protein